MMMIKLLVSVLVLCGNMSVHSAIQEKNPWTIPAELSAYIDTKIAEHVFSNAGNTSSSLPERRTLIGRMENLENHVNALELENKYLQRQVQICNECCRRLNPTSENNDRNATSTYSAEKRDFRPTVTENTPSDNPRGVQFPFDSAVRAASTTVPKIAFSAYLKTSIGVTEGMTLVLETATLNLGSNYNVATGIFTASVAGIYVIHYNIYASFHKHAYGDLMKNGVAIAWTVGVGTVDYTGIGSALIVTSLNQGDRLWIKVHGGSAGAALYSEKTTFSGFLLYNS